MPDLKLFGLSSSLRARAEESFGPSSNHGGCGRQAEDARRRGELREIGTEARTTRVRLRQAVSAART